MVPSSWKGSGQWCRRAGTGVASGTVELEGEWPVVPSSWKGSGQWYHGAGRGVASGTIKGYWFDRELACTVSPVLLPLLPLRGLL